MFKEGSMRFKVQLVSIVALVLSAAAVASAQETSRTIAFSGIVTIIAPSSSSQALTLQLWDAATGGAQLYCENQTLDVDDNSAISFTLGTGSAPSPPCPSVPPGLNPNNFPAGASRYLDVVDNTATSVLSARVPLTAAAFAMSSFFPGTNVSGNLAGPILTLSNFGSQGLVAAATNTAISGQATGNGVGVFGRSDGPNGVGLSGFAPVSGGNSSGIGVAGESNGTFGTGVSGIAHTPDGWGGFFQNTFHGKALEALANGAPIAKFTNNAPDSDRTAAIDLQSGSGVRWRLGVGGSGNSLSLSQGQLYLENIFNGPAKFVLQPDGKVGIGTSTPISKLQVETSEVIPNVANAAVMGRHTASGGGANWAGFFESDGTGGTGVIGIAGSSYVPPVSAHRTGVYGYVDNDPEGFAIESNGDALVNGHLWVIHEVKLEPYHFGLPACNGGTSNKTNKEGTLAYTAGGGNNDGHLYVCRVKADFSYEWKQVF